MTQRDLVDKTLGYAVMSVFATIILYMMNACVNDMSRCDSSLPAFECDKPENVNGR